MQSLADRLADLPKWERDQIISGYTEEQLAALLWDWRGYHARPEQIEPDGDWDIWIALAGRGWGKTRAGAEWIKEQVANGCKRIAIIAETAADGRDVLVEGESGILSVYPEPERPLYESSKRRLTWANGAVATVFNATEPDQLRGPQFDAAWCDELAKWKYARETWDQLQFGLRLGKHPRVIVTTTPRPIELVKAIVGGKEGKVAVTRGSTMDNARNLAKPFLSKIRARYEGTRLGRQELEAEILGDLPGALWNLQNLDGYRKDSIPKDLNRIVVAIDPAVTNTDESDEHGIVVCAKSKASEGFILADGSTKGSPNDWARAAVALYDQYEADAIVAEVNNGGDMVANTIRTIRANINVIEVRASRGKHVRAEPIAALYEQGRVSHVGSFPELENQMTQMTNVGYEGGGSPDRVDALVWGMTELFPSLLTRPAQKAPRPPAISMV